ncbi:hypothetical protein QQX98_006874 [Neonectria punicea]|uniref:F-box domain-containing protein n=1 Tax=Neonectria punicea TaxID=979145 RepID=A0ABR1GZV0_9HYPO
MTQVIVDHHTRVEIQPSESVSALTLFDALCNSLVLRNTVPYLPVSGLLSLAATCRDFRYLVYQTPGVFRHLDLTHVKTAQPETKELDNNDLVWHNPQLIDYLTEDDFYSGPLRGVFSTLRQRDLLHDVQSLILDGLSVTAEICHEIINDSTYNVRLLSIRDVKHMNHGKLRAALAYACRSSRPEGMPRLKGLYVFGSKDTAITAAPAAHDSVGTGWNHKSHQALAVSLQAEAESWWFKKGRMVTSPVEPDWANCMETCQGLITFDAVLCQGPRHRNSPVYAYGPSGSAPAMATFAVGGCASCGKAPEGLMHPDVTPSSCLPLLAPPPILSSSVQAATMPGPGHEAFTPRCADCLSERFCVCCNKWWCESCYYLPGQGMLPGQGHDMQGARERQQGVVIVDYDGAWTSLDSMSRSSSMSMESPEWTFAKSKCDECIQRTQKVCKKCCGGYCLTHNEGSSESFCDWCVSRGRGLTRL